MAEQKSTAGEGGAVATETSDNAPGMGERAFLLVWFGQTVSAFGSGLTTFALAVWVYQQTQSLTQFGFVLFVNAIVTALVAPFLGVVCDRYPLRRLMLVADGGAALLTTAMLLLVVMSRLALWHVIVVVAIDAVLTMLHQIAYRAAIPALVRKSQLPRANGMVGTGVATSSLLAPMAAGALLAGIGLAGIFVVDLLTFLMAVGTLLLARFPKAATHGGSGGQSSPDSPVQHRSRDFLRELGEGWRYLCDRPGLRGLLAVVLAASFALASVQVLFTPMVLAAHEPRVLGLLTAAGSLGMLASGLFIAVRGRHASARVVIGCQAMMATCLLAIGLMQSVWLLGLLLFASYGFSQWGSIVSRTIWQNEVDAAMRGRVFALLSASSAAIVPLAHLGAPWLAERVLQPWLEHAGPAARIAIGVLGDGPGRAAALMIAITGVALLVFGVVAQRQRAWRELVRMTTVLPAPVRP